MKKWIWNTVKIRDFEKIRGENTIFYMIEVRFEW